VIAPIQGGLDLSLRRYCAELYATRDVHGFLIDGLCADEGATEDLGCDVVNAVLENTVVSFFF
jgi:Queuine/archaeosine tRNA-ribosyltransferase